MFLFGVLTMQSFFPSALLLLCLNTDWTVAGMEKF